MSSRVWKIFAALVVTALCNGAKAQDITMQGIARSISAHYYVRTVCPRFFKVDVPMASKIAADTLDMGSKMYDPAAFRAAVAAEVPRRGKEVSATGAQPWCSYQRTVLITGDCPDASSGHSRAATLCGLPTRCTANRNGVTDLRI